MKSPVMPSTYAEAVNNSGCNHNIGNSRQDSTTTNDSIYVVFMGDGRASYTKDEEHAGLLFTGENGQVAFFHSSKNSPGSLSIVEYYPDISAFERDFAYNTFYYQEIR